MKKVLCFAGILLHLLLAALGLAWVAMFASWDIAYKQLLLAADGAILIATVIIGKLVLKIGIDELLTPVEIEGLQGMNRIFYLGSLLAVRFIFGFEILMVLIFFFEGVKMEFLQFLRFAILPSISLAHIVLSSCCYFGWRYYALGCEG